MLPFLTNSLHCNLPGYQKTTVEIAAIFGAFFCLHSFFFVIVASVPTTYASRACLIAGSAALHSSVASNSETRGGEEGLAPTVIPRDNLLLQGCMGNIGGGACTPSWHGGGGRLISRGGG